MERDGTSATPHAMPRRASDDQGSEGVGGLSSSHADSHQVASASASPRKRLVDHTTRSRPSSTSTSSSAYSTARYLPTATAQDVAADPDAAAEAEADSDANLDALAAPLLKRSHVKDKLPVAFTWLHGRTTMGVPTLGKQGVIVLLCVINLINYIDRGIIPGSPEKFQHFISRTLHIEVTQQSFYLGLLASSFIASYSVCSMIFGYWATKFRPFRMIAFGMSVWVVAVICCGVAHSLDSYYFLMFGRVLSGVGEASFQCNATPFINAHAPKSNRALWMGVYLASITVGTAMGYIYGSALAATSLTWAGAFYIEGLIMVGLIACCLYCVPDELDAVPADYDSVKIGTPCNLADELLQNSQPRQSESKLSAYHAPAVPPTSFFAGWWEIFRNPTFALVVLGHAAYTFSLAALSVFSPVILIGLGLYRTETEVSTAFGGLIVITGTIGTPLGGILLDRMTKRDFVSSSQRAYISVKIIFGMMLAAFVFALVMMGFTSSKLAFLGVMAICFLFLCALSPAETVVVMELFPESRHAMAIAANTLVIHVLGDVPSPIILGWLKDTWAPRCGTVEIDGRAELNPECHLDRAGLKNVLLFPVLWLIWGVVLWGVATLVLRRRLRTKVPTPAAV